MNRLGFFPFGLDRHKPLAAVAGYGDVPGRAEHVPAVAVTQPAQFRQKHAAVAGVDLELLGVGVAQAVRLAFLLQAWEVGAFGKEILVSPFQVFQGVLQGMNRRIAEPVCLGTMAPSGEVLCHRHIVDEFLACFVIGYLHRQPLVKHEPARSREAAQEALLLAVGL